MIGLGRVKTPIGLDLGDYRRIENVRSIELGDIGVRNFGLLRTRRKDRRAILSASIWALMIEFCRVVRDREIDLQDPPITDALRIEGDANQFGVARGPRAYHLIMSGRFVASRVARDSTGDALDVLKHALHAPEASAGKHGHLRCRLRLRRLVERGRGYHVHILGRAGAGQNGANRQQYSGQQGRKRQTRQCLVCETPQRLHHRDHSGISLTYEWNGSFGGAVSTQVA